MTTVSVPGSPAAGPQSAGSLAERDRQQQILGRQTKRSFFRSKPGVLERAVGVLTLLFLTTGLPNEWFVIVTGDASDDVVSGGPLIIAVFALLTGTLLIFSMKQPKMMFYLITADLVLVLFSFLVLFSVLWSVDFAVTGRRAVALMLTTLLGLYYPARYTLEEIVTKLFYVFFVTMVIDIVWVFAFPQYGTNISNGDFLGITTNRNTLGQQMVLGCLVMAFSMGSRKLRFPAIIGLAGCFYLVIGSTSKTSLVSALLLGLLIFVFRSFRAKKTLFGAVIVSELTAAVFGLLFATANLVFITDVLNKDITLTGRTLLWESLLRPISERPFLGYGWEAFWGGWGSPAHEIWAQYNWFPPTAHNAPLEMLVSIGLVGMVLWATMLGRGLWRSIHYLRDREGLVGLFPIAIFSFAVLYSVTEAGVVHRGIDWMLFVVALAETKRFMDRNRSQLDNRIDVRRKVVIRDARKQPVASSVVKPVRLPPGQAGSAQAKSVE